MLKGNNMVYYHNPLIYSSLKTLLNLLLYLLVVVPRKWNYLLYFKENVETRSPHSIYQLIFVQLLKKVIKF